MMFYKMKLRFGNIHLWSYFKIASVSDFKDCFAGSVILDLIAHCLKHTSAHHEVHVHLRSSLCFHRPAEFDRLPDYGNLNCTKSPIVIYFQAFVSDEQRQVQSSAMAGLVMQAICSFLYCTAKNGLVLR